MAARSPETNNVSLEVRALSEDFIAAGDFTVSRILTKRK
jgi:hypothetical protein